VKRLELEKISATEAASEAAQNSEMHIQEYEHQLGSKKMQKEEHLSYQKLHTENHSEPRNGITRSDVANKQHKYDEPGRGESKDQQRNKRNRKRLRHRGD
jgi:DNA-binding protein H-NS